MSGRMSTNTGTAPRSTKAFAVEGKVNEGRMTSSPGPTSARSAAISRAAVPEWVSNAREQPTRPSSHSWHRLVNVPSPDSRPARIASPT